jgi:hypothetical protein
MSDARLVKFATAFREGVLDGRPSWMMCFAISAPLAGLLEAHGVRAELCESDLGEWNHVWLRLADGRVLDPTADQFNELFGYEMPPVYLGPPTNLHASDSDPAAAVPHTPPIRGKETP